MLKSYKGRGVILPPNYSYYFLHIGNHNLKTRLCEASWGKVNKPKRQKKRLSLGNANPQFFSFLLIVVWRGWIGILLGREVTSTDDWQFSYSLKHHWLRLIGRGARLSELHWLYETRRPPWKPLFRYQNTFLRKLEAELLHYSETQATIFWGFVIIKIWMKLENSRP